MGSDADIEEMVRNAEANAEADKERKQAIEARNDADSPCYSTEKPVDEHAEKLDDETKAEIKRVIAEVRTCLDNENASLNEINDKKEQLNQAAQKIGQAIYGTGGDANASTSNDGSDSDDTVDAEYEEKKDEK